MDDELLQHRIDKLERIRALCDNPYKYSFQRSCTIGEARATFEATEGEVEDPGAVDLQVTVAGRLMATRDQGKVMFADLRDETGKIQLFIKKNTVGDEAYASLKDLDIGDFIGVSGPVKRTRMGEITVFVESYEILTKALRGLPEKYHGLTDIETRYRQRYLDMIANPEVMETFKSRIKVVASMRTFLIDKGFLEVETPMLQPIPGGATAAGARSVHSRRWPASLSRLVACVTRRCRQPSRSLPSHITMRGGGGCKRDATGPRCHRRHR